MTITRKLYVLILVLLCQGCGIWDFQYPEDCLYYQSDSGSSEQPDSNTDIGARVDAECTEGPCCDEQGRFRKETYSCNTETEYRCNYSVSGASTQQSQTKQFCTGTSAVCEGMVVSSTWTTIEECGSRYSCESDGSAAECVYCPYGRVEHGCEPLRVVAGLTHTCTLLLSGDVRCWGAGLYGIVGYGNQYDIGDDEHPLTVRNPVDIGGKAVQIAAGDTHTCVILESGEIRCWGSGQFGQLGYGNKTNIGDDEHPSSVRPVDVGGPAKQITAGYGHTCALLESGDVRCWGMAGWGMLGYGDTESIGDDELPSSVDPVNVGGTVTYIGAGYLHTCALLDTKEVKCWGRNNMGQLGYGNTDDVTLPITVGTVDVGGPVIQLSVGLHHTCVLLESGQMRCWGRGNQGQLGYYGGREDKINIGDDELPSSVDPIDVGGVVTQIAAGSTHTCALLESGEARCWGDGTFGRLGLGNTFDIGDNEPILSTEAINLGGSVFQIIVGNTHTCALLESGGIKCWGDGRYGLLGYGNKNDIGDDYGEMPPDDVLCLW